MGVAHEGSRGRGNFRTIEMRRISLEARYRAKYGIKAGLRGYQLKAAGLGARIPNYALLMAPRLGKTRIDIAVAGYRFKNDGIKRWVVVCPAIAKDVWSKEIASVLDVPFKLEIVEGKAKERQLLLKEWEDIPGKLSIVVMNHEATWRLKKFLYKFNPDKVTIDESHKIKNHTAKQSVTLHTLGRRARFRCILTGTFLSTPMDAFSQYKFLDPTIFGERWKDYKERYVDRYGYGGLKPKTFKNLDELSQKVGSIAYQLTRAQAGGFPQELIQDIQFDLTNPALRHYREMEEELKTVVRGSEVSAKIVLTQVLRCQQITGGFLPVTEPDEDLAQNVPVGNDRMRALSGVLSEYPLTEPIVIFCRFRYELQAILDQLKRMGRSSSTIAGGMDMAVRDRAKNDFQQGRVSTCVVQIRAGGIAIDLSRADTSIFYSLTSSFIDYEQAMARTIARTGGSKAILHLTARGTVDEDILESVRAKKSLAEEISKKLG